ncbi:MAG: caspase family protein [Anaerolineales bacterium]|nr:caspase family protein [Anaerolineales bacterium]
MSKRIALVIDNRAYQDDLLSQLPPLQIESQALIAILLEPSMGNFNSVELLTNPSVAQLRYHLSNLFNRKKQFDVLLLYYLGHAIIDTDHQWYLAVTDTRCDGLAETAVSAGYISNLMDRSLSHQQILVLDCCCGHTPQSLNLMYLADKAGLDVAFKGNGYGRVVLTASNTIDFLVEANKVSGAPEPSVFTQYLIEGLRTGGADGDGDGQIGVEELYEYVYYKVIRQTNQKPRLWTYHSPDKFILGRNPKEVEMPRPVKWDLIFGAVMAPIVTVIIGGLASLSTSVGLAGLFLLMYAFLYWTLD